MIGLLAAGGTRPDSADMLGLRSGNLTCHVIAYRTNDWYLCKCCSLRTPLQPGADRMVYGFGVNTAPHTPCRTSRFQMLSIQDFKNGTWSPRGGFFILFLNLPGHVPLWVNPSEFENLTARVGTRLVAEARTKRNVFGFGPMAIGLRIRKLKMGTRHNWSHRG
jgi:hypothetical protein